MYKFTLLVLLAWSGSLAAQDAYAPHLLIPYNDHGEWGYCDTLGAVHIKGAFANADFFTQIKMTPDVMHAAKVETAAGINYVSPVGELLFPEEVDVQYGIRLDPKRNRGFLVAQDGKLGIYRAGSGWHTRPVYDSISNLANIRAVLLLKKDEEATFEHIDSYSGHAESTDITELKEYFHNGSIALLAHRSSGSFYEIMNGQLIPRSTEEVAAYEALEGLFYEEMAELPPSMPPPYRQWHGAPITPEQLGVDRLIDTRDYTKLPTAAQYGFTKLIIGQKDGQQGVLNEAGDIILPFQYDRIIFTKDGAHAELWQGDQQGYKFFFSHHPTIEPQYNRLEIGRQLYVSPRWRFTILAMRRGDNRGFVGENGVEYFELE